MKPLTRKLFSIAKGDRRTIHDTPTHTRYHVKRSKKRTSDDLAVKLKSKKYNFFVPFSSEGANPFFSTL
jgi:hypothetical protein